ncbi:orotidine-5'-phosphate decarboxylase [Chloroflexota bacterium]
MTFIEKLNNATEKNDSLLCIGIDPDPELMPDRLSILDFNRAIIDATRDLVCAYKLNFAFYEVFGDEGFGILKRTVGYIPDEIPVIGDAKRGDIGNTARAYARSIFLNLNFDATTVNPYLGFDSIEPFIEYEDKGVFVLCRTSNPSAADFQSLNCNTDSKTTPLFEMVAARASQWNSYGNIGLVVGATYPDELKLIRQSHPDMPLLIPGIGAQGGDLKKAVSYGVDASGEKAIINSSRQVIYSLRSKDFDAAARKAASKLRDRINRYRNK